MNKTTRHIISAIITIVIAALGFYVALPAINLHSEEFWASLIFVIVIYTAAYFLLGIKSAGGIKNVFTGIKSLKIAIIAVAVPIAVIIIGGIISSVMGGSLAENLKRAGLCAITLFLLGLIGKGWIIGVTVNAICYFLIFVFFALIPKKRFKRRRF